MALLASEWCPAPDDYGIALTHCLEAIEAELGIAQFVACVLAQLLYLGRGSGQVSFEFSDKRAHPPRFVLTHAFIQFRPRIYEPQQTKSPPRSWQQNSNFRQARAF
ncbi:hypothetical protein [Mesorhizobium sp. B2-5-4]|uniref:hypothetical protein n=1 Tax=Mesorhizobium sp. B2-5-4 TaxID=2589926 RepID=UPI0015E3F02D|nr:hypothetical protein [Mesorhizobium sp. B2-5-4]